MWAYKLKPHRYLKPFKSYCRFRFFPAAILDFRWKEGSDFFADGTIEKPVPENGGVDTGIVSLSGRWAKLEGGANLHPPPRCWRYKKGSAVRGLITVSHTLAHLQQ